MLSSLSCTSLMILPDRCSRRRYDHAGHLYSQFGTPWNLLKWRLFYCCWGESKQSRVHNPIKSLIINAGPGAWLWQIFLFVLSAHCGFVTIIKLSRLYDNLYGFPPPLLVANWYLFFTCCEFIFQMLYYYKHCKDLLTMYLYSWFQQSYYISWYRMSQITWVVTNNCNLK